MYSTDAIFAEQKSPSWSLKMIVWPDRTMPSRMTPATTTLRCTGRRNTSRTSNRVPKLTPNGEVERPHDAARSKSRAQTVPSARDAPYRASRPAPTVC